MVEDYAVMFIDGNVMKSNHMLHPNEVILNFEGNLTCSLASDSPLPMTLKDYCVRHGVSVSLAKFRHPDLCASYMRQWKVESRGRISNQLRVARTACETLRLEWGDQRFFTDLAITAAHVASATGVSRAIVMRPLRVLATLRPYEGETFRSLVERLPLPVNDLRALIAVTRPICDKPAALVLPGDLVAPMSELEKEYTGRGISVLGIVVALKEAYQELGLTKYGRMTGKAGYGGWESILKTYRRTKRGEIRQDDVGVQIVKEYWSELLAFGPSVARLRFFISLGCPRMDIYDDILATGRLYRGPSRLAFQVKDGGETWTISVLDDELARVALSLGPPARKSTFWKAVVSTHRYALSAGVSPEDALGRNLGFYPFRKLVKGLLYDSLRKHRLPCVGLSLCMERMQQTDSEALRLAVEETLATWRALLAGE